MMMTTQKSQKIVSVVTLVFLLLLPFNGLPLASQTQTVPQRIDDGGMVFQPTVAPSSAPTTESNETIIIPTTTETLMDNNPLGVVAVSNPISLAPSSLYTPTSPSYPEHEIINNQSWIRNAIEQAKRVMFQTKIAALVARANFTIGMVNTKISSLNTQLENKTQEVNAEIQLINNDAADLKTETLDKLDEALQLSTTEGISTSTVNAITAVNTELTEFLETFDETLQNHTDGLRSIALIPIQFAIEAEEEYRDLLLAYIQAVQAAKTHAELNAILPPPRPVVPVIDYMLIGNPIPALEAYLAQLQNLIAIALQEIENHNNPDPDPSPEPNPDGFVSAYSDTIPQNEIYWDPFAMGLNKVIASTEIHRKDPLSSTFQRIATLEGAQLRYVDKDFNPSLYQPFIGDLGKFSYKVVLNYTDGTTTQTMSPTVNASNYNQAELTLNPENLLVIGSSSTAANGKSASYLKNLDGSLIDLNGNPSSVPVDLVDYYVSQRNIPASNVFRMNTTDGRVYEWADFQQNFIRPLWDYLVANNLDKKIYAITTMPGANVLIKNGPFGTSGVPVQNVISLTLAAYIKGKALGQSADTVMNQILTSGISAASASFNSGSMSDATLLGFTRMETGQVIPTLPDIKLDVTSVDHFLAELEQSKNLNGVTLPALTNALESLGYANSTDIVASLGGGQGVFNTGVWTAMFDDIRLGASNPKKFNGNLFDVLTLLYPEKIAAMAAVADGTALYNGYKTEIEEALNRIKNDVRFIEKNTAAGTGSPYFIQWFNYHKTPTSSAYNNYVLQDQLALLVSKGVMDTTGKLLKPEASLTAQERTEIEWLNNYVFGFLYGNLGKNQFANIQTILNNIISGNSWQNSDRAAFMAAYAQKFVDAALGSTDPKMVAIKAVFSKWLNPATKSQTTALELAQACRDALQILLPSLKTTASEAKTASQRLKELIDDTLASEQNARDLADQGVGPEYYAHIFDLRGNAGGAGMKPSSIGGYGWGDYLFETARRMLDDLGYSIYEDYTDSTLTSAYTVKDPQFLEDLASGKMALANYSGWYRQSGGAIYDYIRSLSETGEFMVGGGTSALDSYKDNQWHTFRWNGTVYATNAEQEPYVTGLSPRFSAYLWGGFPAAFASVLSTQALQWMTNIFADPLYNIGKIVLKNFVKPILDGAGKIVSYIKNLATGSLNPTTVQNPDTANTSGVITTSSVFGDVKGKRSITLDATTGKITHEKVGVYDVTYNEDGTATFKSLNDMSRYTVDRNGKIIAANIRQWEQRETTIGTGANARLAMMGNWYRYDIDILTGRRIGYINPSPSPSPSPTTGGGFPTNSQDTKASDQNQ